MNTQVNKQAHDLQKTIVKQDICIEYYGLVFEAKPDVKKNKGLDGKARTQPDILKIFEIIKKECIDYEYYRNSKRYIHSIEDIRFQKRSIEILVSCNDTEHQGFVKKNSRNKSRTPIPFNMDEGSETISHIVIRFDEENTNSATVFFERSQGITLKIVEALINKLLEKIRQEEGYSSFFVEPYVSDNHTPFYFKIEANFYPIADKEIIERIRTGDFLDLCIVEKEIQQEEHELPILVMYESQNIYKPSSFWSSTLSFNDIVSGIKKIGAKNRKGKLSNSPIMYKLRYSDAGNTRIVELKPEEENIASMCQKKKWFKDYERRVVDGNVAFDETLCKKMFSINIDNQEE